MSRCAWSGGRASPGASQAGALTRAEAGGPTNRSERWPSSPPSRATGGAWQWQRTAQTQRALLDAAREVFTEQGFTEASIADVVERAGSSVGSLYHHFGGKSELFLALYQEHQFAHEEAAREAVAAAKQAGETDATELFCAGARAFLDGTWQRRDLAMLFFAGDGPPGFEVIKRRRGREWIGQNDALLRLPDTALDRLLRGHPDVADRRGRPRGGHGQDPPPGQPDHRRGHRVLLPADERRRLEARGRAGRAGGRGRG